MKTKQIEVKDYSDRFLNRCPLGLRPYTWQCQASERLAQQRASFYIEYYGHAGSLRFSEKTQ